MTHATEVAERSCQTCAHAGLAGGKEPCWSCLHALPRWEPRPPEPPCPGAAYLGEYNTPNGRRDAWWVSGAVLIGECAWTPEHIAHPTLIRSDWRPVYRAALARAEELGLVEKADRNAAEAATAQWWEDAVYWTRLNALFDIAVPNSRYWAHFVWSALPEAVRAKVIGRYPRGA